MLRIVSITLFLLLSSWGSGTVLAQTQIPINQPLQKFHHSVGVGISAPTGVLEDAGRRGFHVWGRVCYALGTNVEIAVGPEYHTFDRDNFGQYGTYGGRFYTLMIAADLRYNLGHDREKRNPYLFAGLGWAHLQVQPLTTIERGTERFDSAEGPMFEAGAGLEHGWTFLQVKVVIVAKRYIGDRLTFLPFSIGFRF